MIVEVETIKLYAPWVHSLKEKRSIVKSVVAKTRNKFNVSIAEVDGQELHQTIILGIACVVSTASMADRVMDKLNSYIQSITEADMVEIIRETR